MREAPRDLTPPEVAQRLAVKPAKILGWIRSGRLRAINVANPGCRRPRFRIDPADLQVFLATLTVHPPAKLTRRRRNAKTDVITFF